MREVIAPCHTHTQSSVSLGDSVDAGSRHDSATVESPHRHTSTQLYHYPDRGRASMTVRALG